MIGEILCDVCKDQKFFCPTCKTQGTHMVVKSSAGIIVPSITKIQAEPYNVDTGEISQSFPMYELHNFICNRCHIVFGIHNLGKPIGIIT